MLAVVKRNVEGDKVVIYLKDPTHAFPTKAALDWQLGGVTGVLSVSVAFWTPDGFRIFVECIPNKLGIALDEICALIGASGLKVRRRKLTA